MNTKEISKLWIEFLKNKGLNYNNKNYFQFNFNNSGLGIVAFKKDILNIYCTSLTADYEFNQEKHYNKEFFIDMIKKCKYLQSNFIDILNKENLIY